MKWITSFFGGVVLGVASVLLHNTFLPIGIAVSLISIYLGVIWIGKNSGKRKYKVVAGIGWVAIVFRAASPGIGGEILVEGNFAGNALIVGGVVSLLFAIFSKV